MGWWNSVLDQFTDEYLLSYSATTHRPVSLPLTHRVATVRVIEYILTNWRTTPSWYGLEEVVKLTLKEKSDENCFNVFLADELRVALRKDGWNSALERATRWILEAGSSLKDGTEMQVGKEYCCGCWAGARYEALSWVQQLRNMSNTKIINEKDLVETIHEMYDSVCYPSSDAIAMNGVAGPYCPYIEKTVQSET